MSTITKDQEAAIADWVGSHDLSVGVGTEDSACSIAAINLALSGRLTDEIPDCMSAEIGHWIILIQDAMPSESRNSARWKNLLPLAAGTGRAHERVRRAMNLTWLFAIVLPELQMFADVNGFGEAWKNMCVARDACATRRAEREAQFVESRTPPAERPVIEAVISAVDAARLAVSRGEHTAASAAAAATYVALAVTASAFTEVREAVHARFWEKINPPEQLAKLISVSRT